MNQPLRLSPADMDRLSRLAFNLSHNEKTRKAFAGLVKEVDPGAAKAFNDVALEEKFEAFTKKFEDDRLAERMQNIARARDQQKRGIIAKRKLTEDQVKEVDKLMERHGFNGDWEAAADLYAQRNPPLNPQLQPPPEILHGGSTWEFPTVPGQDGKMLSFEDFNKNPQAATRNAAIQVITEFKRNRLPAAFTQQYR
jgi:hypothetical protein